MSLKDKIYAALVTSTVALGPCVSMQTRQPSTWEQDYRGPNPNYQQSTITPPKYDRKYH